MCLSSFGCNSLYPQTNDPFNAGSFQEGSSSLHPGRSCSELLPNDCKKKTTRSHRNNRKTQAHKIVLFEIMVRSRLALFRETSNSTCLLLFPEGRAKKTQNNWKCQMVGTGGAGREEVWAGREEVLSRKTKLQVGGAKLFPVILLPTGTMW